MATIPRAHIEYEARTVVAARPIQPTPRAPVKLTAGQREDLSESIREPNEFVQWKLDEFHEYSINLTNELTREHGRTPAYYQRLMFMGGVSISKARKPNSYNVWSHQLTKDHNDGKPDLCNALLLTHWCYQCLRD